MQPAYEEKVKPPDCFLLSKKTCKILATFGSAFVQACKSLAQARYRLCQIKPSQITTAYPGHQLFRHVFKHVLASILTLLTPQISVHLSLQEHDRNEYLLSKEPGCRQLLLRPCITTSLMVVLALIPLSLQESARMQPRKNNYLRQKTATCMELLLCIRDFGRVLSLILSCTSLTLKSP